MRLRPFLKTVMTATTLMTLMVDGYQAVRRWTNFLH